MFGKNDDEPTFEEFIKGRDKHLDKIIEQNNQDITELVGKGDAGINSMIEDVYKDFFGADFVSKYNHDENASSADALKNAINNVLHDGGLDEHAASAAGVLDAINGAAAGTSGAVASGLGISGTASGAPAGEAKTADGSATATEAEAAKAEELPEKSGMEELQELIGLKSIKHDVAELINLAKVQKMREDMGLKFVPTSLHLVFSGNPGTGKTTVARILARLYKEIGILTKGQLVEVDRSGLVAGYVGQTALKTQEKIQEAMGGVLFIDEAYALAKEGNDYGQEAIDTILKAMEDHRRDFVVIVAGYTKPMEEFINSNPGLRSRFNKYLYFEDYTADELMGIFDLQCKKYSYKLSDEARKEIEALIREREANKDETFANAREIRNLFEDIITNQATRIAGMEAPTEDDILTILPEDLRDSDGTLEVMGEKEEEAEGKSDAPAPDPVPESTPDEEPAGDTQE